MLIKEDASVPLSTQVKVTRGSLMELPHHFSLATTRFQVLAAQAAPQEEMEGLPYCGSCGGGRL